MQIELCTGVIFHIMSDKIHVAVKELNISTFKENANHFRCFKFSLYMYILQARTQKGQSAPSHQLETFIICRDILQLFSMLPFAIPNRKNALQFQILALVPQGK